MVKIFTDGASRGNPGPGGFGTILKFGKHEKALSGGFRKTTNNRMELMAVIAGLEALTKDGLDITIYSDSKYVVDAIEKKWIYGWMKKGFQNKKNQDLWLRLMRAYAKHKVNFVWVKGHAGHHENELCDQLAVEAAEGKNLEIDFFYEQEDNGKLL